MKAINDSPTSASFASLRVLPLLLSMLLIASLYWGLSQAESRAIYATWDKVLHAAVFFLIWWLLRWSVRFSWVWVTALVIAGGGAEDCGKQNEAGNFQFCKSIHIKRF